MPERFECGSSVLRRAQNDNLARKEMLGESDVNHIQRSMDGSGED